jgi:hypothetical protein
MRMCLWRRNTTAANGYQDRNSCGGYNPRNNMSEATDYLARLISRQARIEQRLEEMQKAGGIKPVETPFMALILKESSK